jgi:hypothetical protein
MGTLSALGAWETIISAATITNDPANNVGTVDLGNQSQTGQRGADGVLLEFVWTLGTEDNLIAEISFLDPVGLTDYYIDPDWTTTWTAANMDNDPATLRLHVEPIHEFAPVMRVRFDATTPGATAGTAAVRAKLEGIYKAIT